MQTRSAVVYDHGLNAIVPAHTHTFSFKLCWWPDFIWPLFFIIFVDIWLSFPLFVDEKIGQPQTLIRLEHIFEMSLRECVDCGSAAFWIDWLAVAKFGPNSISSVLFCIAQSVCGLIRGLDRFEVGLVWKRAIFVSFNKRQTCPGQQVTEQKVDDFVDSTTPTDRRVFFWPTIDWSKPSILCKKVNMDFGRLFRRSAQAMLSPLLCLI